MAIAILFTPASMNAEQFNEVHERLDAVGAAEPEGRTIHVCFGEGDKLQVLDVWDSPEAFEAFGGTLMPILDDIGLDAGEPQISPVVRSQAF